MSNTNDCEAQARPVNSKHASVVFNVDSLLASDVIASSTNKSGGGNSFFGPNDEKLNHRIRQCIMECDKDGDGEIDGEEFISLIRVAMKDRATKNNLRKAVIVSVVLLLVLLITTFCSSLAVIIMTRQLTLDSDSGLMVSQSTGRAVSTHAVGGGGMAVELFPFTGTFTDGNGKSQTYRKLFPIAAEISPNGQDLQCMGAMSRANLEDAVHFSVNDASIIRMNIPNDLEAGELVLPLEMKSLWTHAISDDVLETTRRLAEGANKTEVVLPDPDKDFSEENLKRMEAFNSFGGDFDSDNVAGPVTFEAGSPASNTLPGGRFPTTLPEDFRHLQEADDNPTSTEWYAFLAAPKLQVFVCSPEFTGGLDYMCLYCGADY